MNWNGRAADNGGPEDFLRLCSEAVKPPGNFLVPLAGSVYTTAGRLCLADMDCCVSQDTTVIVSVLDI